MAGGKLAPRQKMINLMYLVFIAMLALNMSKEVLSAFGLMNEKFDASNITSMQSNKDALADLDKKASEKKGEFLIASTISHKVEAASTKFYNFVEGLKKEVVEGFELEDGKLPYEAMDKSTVDEKWFSGDGYTAKGNEIMKSIENYKAEIAAAVGNQTKFKGLVDEVNKKFDTKDVLNREKKSVKFLSYHFAGFPAIASVAKLSAWQNDIKKTETDFINKSLGKAAVDETSMKKFQSIVVLDKNAYFTGEKVTGKVVLGKYDPNAKFSGFVGPGKLENGQAVISLTAGGVGEQKIKGSFNFMEDGKPVPLPFEGTYVVVPRPNSATISADKMNVVYRGVVNPMSISFAGIADNAVTASAPGLTKSGNGKYEMRPGTGSEVTIVVSGKMSDGKVASDKKVYRIKGIPGPAGTIRGEMGVVKGPKSSLEISTIGAKLVDFDFEVGLDVVGFNFKVTGQPTVVVVGNKLNAQCKTVLSKVGRGDQVTISEIKTKLVGAGSYLLPRTAPVIYEIL